MLRWGSFPGGKAAVEWSWPHTSNQCRSQDYVDLYIDSAIRLHSVVFNCTGTTLLFDLDKVYFRPCELCVQEGGGERKTAFLCFGTWRNELRRNSSSSKLTNVGYQVLSTVAMKRIVFCVVTSCSSIQLHRRFGEMYCLPLHDLRVNQIFVDYLFVLLYDFLRLRLHVSPKRRWTPT
jgi:hypothetical protein